MVIFPLQFLALKLVSNLGCKKKKKKSNIFSSVTFMSLCLVLKAGVYFDVRWGDLVFSDGELSHNCLGVVSHLYHSSCVRLCHALDLYSLGLFLNLLVHRSL